MMVKKGLKHQEKTNAVRKELLAVARKEQRLRQAAIHAKPTAWKSMMEDKIPEKVYTGLESAFCKGFSLVFKQGRGIIEKGYSKEELQAVHAVRDAAVQNRGGRKELRKMSWSAQQSDLVNLAVTTVEGVALGALGVGMPDIVLFLGTLLKGVYETALNYGFEYESRREQMLILKMLETSLSSGADWVRGNREVDEMIELETVDITEEIFEAQIRQTASTFAMDMLLLKFIQGLPVVGILGGAANPVYYNKIMKYVQLKYKKRYLLKQTD